MRLKENFALRNVADTWVVIPLAEETVNFNGMLTLNDSGAMLWKALEETCDIKSLIDALVNEYEVSYSQAEEDAKEFINKLLEAGCIEE